MSVTGLSPMYEKIRWAANTPVSVANLSHMDVALYNIRNDIDILATAINDIIIDGGGSGGGGSGGGAGAIRLYYSASNYYTYASDNNGVISIPQLHTSWLYNDGDGNGSNYATEAFVNAKQRLIDKVYKREYSNVNTDQYTDTEIAIVDKHLSIPIPKYVSQLINDLSFATTTQVGQKQDALNQEQLYAINSGITSLLVTKLQGIETGAQVNTVNKVNDKIGDVVLNSDDISDEGAGISHKFVSAAEKAQITQNATDIGVIKTKMSSVASESNKLITEQEMQTAINSVSAYPITYNAAKDPFPTKTALTSASTYYSHGATRVPTKNDYAIVLADISKATSVPGYDLFTATSDYVGYTVMYSNVAHVVTATNKDSLGITAGTTIAYYNIPCTKYVYNNGWDFAGIVSDTTLTATQMAAINSGITAALVGQINLNNTNLNNHLLNKTNPHEVTKAQVGLGNVNNTSDADKPISTATQNALDLKENIANIVPVYSASNTYNKGTLVRYDGIIYICTTAITTAEAWDSTHWSAITITGAIDRKQDVIDGNLPSDTLAYVVGLDANNNLKKGTAPNVATVYEVAGTLPFADSDTIAISSTIMANLVGTNLGKNTLKIVDETNDKEMSFVAKWTHIDQSDHMVAVLDGSYVDSNNNTVHQNMTYNFYTGYGVVKEESIIATVNMDIEMYL